MITCVCAASLEQVLQESEQLLGTLSMLTKKQAPAVREFGAAVKATEKAVDAECLELYRYLCMCFDHLWPNGKLVSFRSEMLLSGPGERV